MFMIFMALLLSDDVQILQLCGGHRRWHLSFLDLPDHQLGQFFSVLLYCEALVAWLAGYVPLPHEKLPADTRLWAALQAASGGTWGGCVYDVDSIIAQLQRDAPSEL